MNSVDLFTPEWQEWVASNLQLGCSLESMVDVMVENHFDPHFAVAVIALTRNHGATGFGTTHSVSEATNSRYLYEAPRFSHQGHHIDTEDRTVHIMTRIDKPVIRILDQVLSPEECKELIRLSQNKLQRSAVVNPVTGLEEYVEERTSSGTFFALNENEFIAKLDRRISRIMNWPMENGEGIQILNYKVGGEYRPHFDYFEHTESGDQRHLTGGQRVSTLVIYLNDVEAGGETIFPELDLSVSPKMGAAVYFEYCNSLNQTDPLTLHGGAPVTKGEKWIATKWMRQCQYTYD
jgi:prolyl 4-hydroxylase